MTRKTPPAGRLPLNGLTAELLVDAVTDIALVVLNADGAISIWNKGAELIYGWSKEEVIGNPVSLLYVPDAASHDSLHQDLELVREIGRYEAQGIRSRKDGSTFMARVTVTPVTGADAG